jgi:hypothetical protein
MTSKEQSKKIPSTTTSQDLNSPTSQVLNSPTSQVPTASISKFQESSYIISTPPNAEMSQTNANENANAPVEALAISSSQAEKKKRNPKQPKEKRTFEDPPVSKKEPKHTNLPALVSQNTDDAPDPIQALMDAQVAKEIVVDEETEDLISQDERKPSGDDDLLFSRGGDEVSISTFVEVGSPREVEEQPDLIQQLQDEGQMGSTPPTITIVEEKTPEELELEAFDAEMRERRRQLQMRAEASKLKDKVDEIRDRKLKEIREKTREEQRLWNLRYQELCKIEKGILDMTDDELLQQEVSLKMTKQRERPSTPRRSTTPRKERPTTEPTTEPTYQPKKTAVPKDRTPKGMGIQVGDTITMTIQGETRTIRCMSNEGNGIFKAPNGTIYDKGKSPINQAFQEFVVDKGGKAQSKTPYTGYLSLFRNGTLVKKLV